jgi:hypothetical protein
MTRIRLMVVAALAIFAFSAVAAASAFAAEPELVKNGEAGKEVLKKKITGTGGTAKLQVKGEGTIVCSALTSPGEVTGLKTGTSATVFTSCEFAGLKCKTTGAKAGEISSPAEFTAVYAVKGGVDTPAVLVKPKSTIVIECGATQKLEVKGKFLATAEPVKTITEKGKLVGKQTEGAQEFTEYSTTKSGTVIKLTPGGTGIEEGLVTTGSGTKVFTNVQSGEEATLELTFEEKVELLA